MRRKGIDPRATKSKAVQSLNPRKVIEGKTDGVLEKANDVPEKVEKAKTKSKSKAA